MKKNDKLKINIPPDPLSEALQATSASKAKSTAVIQLPPGMNQFDNVQQQGELGVVNNNLNNAGLDEDNDVLDEDNHIVNGDNDVFDQDGSEDIDILDDSDDDVQIVDDGVKKIQRNGTFIRNKQKERDPDLCFFPSNFNHSTQQVEIHGLHNLKEDDHEYDYKDGAWGDVEDMEELNMNSMNQNPTYIEQDEDRQEFVNDDRISYRLSHNQQHRKKTENKSRDLQQPMRFTSTQNTRSRRKYQAF